MGRPTLHPPEHCRAPSVVQDEPKTKETTITTRGLTAKSRRTPEAGLTLDARPTPAAGLTLDAPTPDPASDLTTPEVEPDAADLVAELVPDADEPDLDADEPGVSADPVRN